MTSIKDHRIQNAIKIYKRFVIVQLTKLNILS